MNKNHAIGVFDSGIGGLSVLKQFIRFLPYEKFIYLGDTARVPYGNRSEETVNRYSKECTDFLISKNVKLIVIACNTVSSVGLETVRHIAKDIPVISMIQPAATAALRSTNNKKIGIIGTRATISSNAYELGIKSLPGGDKVKVISKACPLFVPIVEEGWMRHPATRLVAEDYLSELKKEEIDTLVLGCTHYPLLSQLLMELMPGVAQIDTGEHAAVAALRHLADMNLLVEEGSEYVIKPELEFYVTDVPGIFSELARQFLGFSVEKPVKINLGS